MRSREWPGVALLKLGSLYLVAVLVLGLVMGIGKDYTLTTVHAHMGFLGWGALTVTGITYLLLPGLTASRLAAAHFWLHNLGLPVMLIGLALERTTGDARAEPILGIGSFVVLAALLAFTINLLRNASAPALSGEPRAEVR